MPSDIKKFINPKFLRTIDIHLMRELFARHYKADEIPVAFDGEPAAIRQALTDYFDAPVTEWSEGVIADLHRVAEVGTGEGLQLILNEARRQNVVLYTDEEAGKGEDAPARHDAKHVALHTYLHHHRVFEAAADFQALRAPSAMAEFRGPRRHVDADLTEDTKSAFREAVMNCSPRICRASTAVSASTRRRARSISSSVTARRSPRRPSSPAIARKLSPCAR